MQPDLPGGKRILSLDVLRGVAILGILCMNIQHFSMPVAAYSNPTAFGNLEGINRWIWIISDLLAREKFISVFSMLFGAGILIFNERAIARGAPDVILHYRRMFWLLVFGLLHAYLLWSGDILVSYSLCGMLVFIFRKLKPYKLILLSFLFFIIPMVIPMLMAIGLPHMPDEVRASMLLSWKPDPQAISNSLEVFRGNWMKQMELRAPNALFLETGVFMMSVFWRVMSMMLLGMALYKWRILDASGSVSFYLRMALAGLVPGMAISALGIWQNFSHAWSMEYSMFAGQMYNYVGSLGVALGYVALVMLICRAKGWQGFAGLFSRVGRTAFSNYILQTLLATFIFYGHGLGLFGMLERKCLWLIMIAIWILNLIFSFLWLRFFKMGPLEALWRKLTYGPWSSRPGS